MSQTVLLNAFPHSSCFSQLLDPRQAREFGGQTKADVALWGQEFGTGHKERIEEYQYVDTFSSEGR